MSYTISTHNGSTVSRQHNLRNPKVVSKEAHIIPQGIHETWLDHNPREMYKTLFGKALNEYNASVRRDRQILDYYTQVNNSAKQHPVYEMIVQVGSVENQPNSSIAKHVLHDFAAQWKNRNPNLVLTGVYYHADEEGAPHLHVDYIPVAHGYKRGLSVQAGLVKALGEQGFQKKGHETAQIAWEKRENHALEEICNQMGLSITHPTQKVKGHANTSAYKAAKELKRQQMKAEEYERLCKETEERIKALVYKGDKIGAGIHTYKRLKDENAALKEFLSKLNMKDKNLLDIFKEHQNRKNRQKPTLELDER